MTELITQKELTRSQAEEMIALWHATGRTLRTLALQMFDGDAHIAVGYKRFDDFAVERLEVSKPEYVYQLLRWARVERAICTIVQMDSKKLTRDTAMELAKLPDAETQAKVYAEVHALKQEGLRTPREYAQEIKKRVGFLLKQTPKMEPPKDTFTRQDFPKPEPAPAKEETVKPSVSSYSETFADGDFADDTPKVEQRSAELLAQPASKVPIEPDWHLWELELQIALNAVKFHSLDSVTDPIGTMATMNDIVTWIEGAI